MEKFLRKDRKIRKKVRTREQNYDAHNVVFFVKKMAGIDNIIVKSIFLRDDVFFNKNIYD